MNIRTALPLAVIVVALGLHVVPTSLAQSAKASSTQTLIESGTVQRMNWLGLVESLAKHPDVLTKDWSGFRRVLPVGCFRDTGSRDLSCPEMSGIVRIAVDPGPLGIVDVVLTAPANCEEIYSVLSKRFGRGIIEGGDKCSVEWNLNRLVKRASANISRGRKDPSQIYLQFAIEQGP